MVAAHSLKGAQKDRAIFQLQEEVSGLKRALKRAHQRSLDDNEIREMLRILGDAPVKAPSWLISDPKRKGVAPGAAEVLQTIWSDWHGAEVVSREETDGANEFNLEIMEARVRRLVERTIKVAKEHGPDRISGAVVNLLGDFVSGGLHPELLKTDEEEILPVVLRIVELLVWALRKMADCFGQLYVPCTAGNHGRATHKPEFKRYVYKNFDYLIYKLVQREFKNAHDDRVVFDIRPANQVFYRVWNQRYLAMHGDMLGVKGGDGIIGALGPITRGEIKVRGNVGSYGGAYDILVIGHWHQELWLPRVIVANSLKGFDEYAKNALRAPVSKPSQPLWFVHPKWGITSRWDVKVDEYEQPTRGREAEWLTVFDPARTAA